MAEQQQQINGKHKKNGNRKNANSTIVSPPPNVQYIPELNNCVFKVGGGAQFQSQRDALADYCKHDLKNIIAWHLIHGREMAPVEPTEPPANANKVVLAKYNTKLKHFLDKSDEYDNIKALAFGTVKRQCDPLVKSRLTSATDFEQIEADGDVVELLNRIKSIVNKKIDGQYPHWQLAEDLRLFLSYRMQHNDNIHTHAVKWKELLKNITSRWGNFGPTNLEPLQTHDEETNKLHACLFLSGLDRGKYGHVVQELNNEYLLNQSGYPKSVDEMVIYLDSRMERKFHKRPGHKNGNKPTNDNDDGEDEGTGATSFAQAASEQATEQREEAHFNQYLTRHGISYTDYSFGPASDSESDSDYITDWHGGKIAKKDKKKNK
jgi:hypothetical protein